MLKKPLVFLLGLFIALSLLSGCQLGFPGVYSIDIPQGNLLDESKVSEVQLGMEPRQVRYLLGTPLINDSFNPDRWDYYYSVHSEGKTQVDHHLVITFTDGRVSAIDNRQQSTN